MTEPTTETVTAENQSGGEQQPDESGDLSKIQAALQKERQLRKDAEKTAKEFDAQRKAFEVERRQFDQQRKATMSEAERSVLEAEERGRSAAVEQYGKRLAQTEFRAAAAARNSEYDVAKALKYVDLTTFFTDQGEVDDKAIAAAVADLIPEAGPTPRYGSADQGPRQDGTSKNADMNSFIRRAAGRA